MWAWVGDTCVAVMAAADGDTLCEGDTARAAELGAAARPPDVVVVVEEDDE